MKKILCAIGAAALVFAAITANAACSFKFTAGSIYCSDGTTKYSGSATIYASVDSSRVEVGTVPVKIGGAFDTASNTLTWDDAVGGTTYTFYFTVVHEGKTFTSSSKSVMASSTATTSCAFGNQATATQNADNWKTSSLVEVVPQPAENTDVRVVKVLCEGGEPEEVTKTDDKYLVTRDAEVTVTFAADVGYAFADGSSTWDVDLTASNDRNVVNGPSAVPVSEPIESHYSLSFGFSVVSFCIEDLTLQAIKVTGDDASGKVFLSTVDAYDRHESNYMWCGWLDEPGWVDLEDLEPADDVDIAAGQGYLVQYNGIGACTLDATGQPVSGDVSVTLRYGGTLAGNPYAKTIDLTSIVPEGQDTSDNVNIRICGHEGFFSASYTWSDWVGDEPCWMCEDYSELTPGTVLLAPGEGFCVRGTGSAQSIRFSEASE